MLIFQGVAQMYDQQQNCPPIIPRKLFVSRCKNNLIKRFVSHQLYNQKSQHFQAQSCLSKQPPKKKPRFVSTKKNLGAIWVKIWFQLRGRCKVRCFPGQIVQVFNPSWIVQVVWRIKIRELDFIPPNPNPTNQPTSWWKKVTPWWWLLKTRVGSGEFGGVGFRHWGFLGRNFVQPPWGHPKKTAARSCLLLRWKNTLQKNEEVISHLRWEEVRKMVDSKVRW